MLETLLFIGVGVVLFTVVVSALEYSGQLPSWVTGTGPLLTFETQRGLGRLDGLARHRRTWRLWTDGGTVVSGILLVGTFSLVLVAAYAAVTTDAASEVNQPRNALAIPGVNEFLPLSATPEIVTGLFVGLFVHEFGHGLLGRVEDVGVESAGLIFLTVVPFGAFVGLDEDDERAASRRSRARIYAAGVTNNLALAVLTFVLLIVLVSSSIAAVPGLAVGGVAPDTPAADAGLERGDVITAVDGQPIDGDETLEAALADANRTVDLTIAGGREGTVTLERSVVVTGTLATDDGETELEPGETITAVDGHPVHTEAAFREALANDTHVTLETDDGSNATIVSGVAVAAVTPDGALAAAGAPDPAETDSFVLTHVAGERVVDDESLHDVLEDATPGETVSLEAVVDDEERTYEVTLGDRDGEAIVGFTPVVGTGGLTVTDVGVVSHPTDQHLAVLGGDGTTGVVGSSAVDSVLAVAFLPFAGAIGLSSANFAGFVGATADFYTVSGPLSVFGSGVFLAANVLFWTWWLNLLLGVFNCIPLYPLDGAKLLDVALETVSSRLPVASPERIATGGTAVVSLVTLVAIVSVFVGPALPGL